MEILDLFEERIQALLAQMQSLKTENEALKKELESCSLCFAEKRSLEEELLTCMATIEENTNKIEELELEKINNAQIRQRIEALLHKVQDALPE